MMAAPVEIKLRNAESSILFMQQEHAKTLQALHQELHKLQKKCAELTFELAMKGDTDEEEELNKNEIKELKDKLEQKEKECSHLREERDNIRTGYVDIEHEVKIQEKVYKDELSQQSQKITVLTAELDQRSGTIAYLTTQLHQLKLKHIKPHTDQDGTESDRVASPAPPKDPAPARVRRYNIRTGNGPIRGLHHAGRAVFRDGRVPEPSQAQSHMFSRFRHVTPSHSTNQSLRTGSEGLHDVTAFIAHVDPSGKEVEVKPAPPILPPITPQDAARRDFSLSTEIETLAIEKPYSVESTLRSPNHSPVHTD